MYDGWRAQFLFTRLTNVGVFVKLLASAIDLGCGDADDDRIYNKQTKTKPKKNTQGKIEKLLISNCIKYI